ncbi:hypothetical protein VIGAN_03096100 [Vigna angularis var. angularis]|uniref:Uncharacterized protein n=1 Tax=Vigna angularis var. angularis TaxID=157739 RepID=A0A0S3RL09_PHAAN|nr:hypothetical protein VIGAN_03096100 [Vigna angularis var. angularis]
MTDLHNKTQMVGGVGCCMLCCVAYFNLRSAPAVVDCNISLPQINGLPTHQNLTYHFSFLLFHNTMSLYFLLFPHKNC